MYKRVLRRLGRKLSRNTSSTKVRKAIPEEAHRTLECIVGPKYVTDNPAGCQAYDDRGCYM